MSLNRFATMLILSFVFAGISAAAANRPNILFISFVFAGISAAAANRPNILFILADDWGMKPYALKDTDPGETKNLYSKHPEIVKRLKRQLDIFKNSGRSAP